MVIIINSKAHGSHNILFDDCDYSLISQYSWHIVKSGHSLYCYSRNSQRKSISMHRLLLGFPNDLVDHINGNGLDNRKFNLRKCNRRQNARNSRIYSSNKFGYKGVVFRDGRYVSKIILDSGKAFTIGRFDNAKEAAIAYNETAKKHFGCFARLNEIQ